MTERSILIFPKFTNQEVIHNLRAVYDPLAKLVQPHITLVFPFTSAIETKQLVDHVSKSIEGIKSFDITLYRISPCLAGGNYLFLNVREGNDEIRFIHDRLYTGILEEFLRKDIPYVPHMTVGKIDDEVEYGIAIQNTEHNNEVFHSRIDKISIEVIGAAGESILEQEVPLFE